MFHWPIKRLKTKQSLWNRREWVIDETFNRCSWAHEFDANSNRPAENKTLRKRSINDGETSRQKPRIIFQLVCLEKWSWNFCEPQLRVCSFSSHFVSASGRRWDGIFSRARSRRRRLTSPEKRAGKAKTTIKKQRNQEFHSSIWKRANQHNWMLNEVRDSTAAPFMVGLRRKVGTRFGRTFFGLDTCAE